jgi:SAM-dependent methyltransferase
MLGVAADKPVEPDWAPIEFAVCPVTAIEAADESFDAVFCQQGLQFFPDRTASLREMRRVLRPGGVVVVATWAAEHPLGLFGPMTEALREAGMEEPYPHAFDPESYSIGAPDLHQLLSEAKLRDVVVETVQLDALWASAGDAVETLMGTPYGPSVRAMPIAGQERVRALFARRLPRSPDGTVTIRTTSNVGRAFK